MKIGISRNVDTRRADISVGCPFNVRVVKRWACQHARRVERKAHKILNRYRKNGEWFDVPADVAVMVVETIVAANPRRGYEPPLDIKTILFCRNCHHTGMIGFIPSPKSKFRCSVCKKDAHVHVVEIANKFLSLDVS